MRPALGYRPLPGKLKDSNHRTKFVQTNPDPQICGLECPSADATLTPPKGGGVRGWKLRKGPRRQVRDGSVPAFTMSKHSNIRVLLVRTGETEWERDGRIAGHSDVPLSEGGKRAAAELARQFEGTHLAVVYCGPDEASIATAGELAKATGARVKPVPCLAEINYGLWEGLLERELEEKCPTAYRQWQEDPSVVQVPEGEMLEDAQERLLTGLSKSLEKNRPEGHAVAFVLRPVALGLVACAINGVPSRNLWSMMKTCLAAQWQTIQRGGIRQRFMQARAGA